MAELIFFLCAVVSIACTAFLAKGCWKNPSPLLFWSSVCFLLLSIDTGDLVFFRTVQVHIYLWRGFLEALAGSALLYGLIMEIA